MTDDQYPNRCNFVDAAKFETTSKLKETQPNSSW